MLLSLLLASFIGATATADRVVVTSGRVVYDAFGRAVKVYHPTVDTDSVYDFIAAIDAVDPTITKYDVLDRPVRVIYPDGTETNTSYRVEGHALVTHVTDALSNETETHVSGSGRTLKSIRFDGPEQIVTQFTYDGIGRLVEVLDADTNVTVSEYDMGDRRVRVSHPASGETTFTYDVLGNVLTRQTANLRDSALFIEYGYDRGRLVSVNYPEHPENNVRYYYGGANDPDNAKGRLCLRLDATGGEQYAYDNMGNVKETVRTVTVPNEDVGTFKTEFEYDSFGKLLSLTYPDGEKVCYWYDGSGQLTEVYVKERKNGYRYVEEIGYDKFGDRVYMRYGNGAETEYAYNDEMRRLDSLSLASPHTTMKRIYGYDAVGNILSVTNSGTGLLHNSPVSHTYVYDNLYRLTEAHGTTGSAQTGYDLAMSYDNMYRITGKTQDIRQTGIQFAGTLNAGYDLSYAYDRTPGRRFRMSSVSDVNYRTVGDPEDGDYIDEEHFYEYDPNGNILHVNTGRWKRDGVERELSREEKFRWDEENRLMAISQDGYVSNYWYDGDGERVIKEHGGNQAVFVNSEQDGVLTDTRQFTIYPSAYLTVHNGSWYTKHVYIGSERIASRMGTMLDALSETLEANAILAGENVFEDMDYDDRCDTLARVMRSNYAYFDLPYNGYNRHGEEMVSTPPRSGDPGILGAGGARHYWMLADADAADADTEGGEGGGPSRGPRRAENVNYNGNRYFYHSDHLGSSSLITDASGNVTQQIDYLPYGEVFLEKRADVDYHTPYRFNGKELDEETGLYYYGARYMNPRLSIWYGTDPLEEKNYNLSSYCFVSGNPMRRIDVTGLTDYDINGKTMRIDDGHDNLKMEVGTIDFNKLQTYFNQDICLYESFMNELSVQNGYVTTSSYLDAESSSGYGVIVMSHVPYGKSYSEWSIENRSKLSPYFGALNYAKSFVNALIKQSDNINIGDNGKWYFRQNSGRIFYSNQYVKTTPASIKYSGLIKGANRIGGTIAIASSGYDIYQGYVQDGNRFGYNAQVQTAGAIGGFAMGALGAKIGAEFGAGVGVYFGGVGAVPGGIIGGIVGGTVFSILGSDQGQQIAKSIIK